MKYIKKIMLITFIMLLGVVMFAGCSQKGPVQLSTPVAAVVLNNGRLMLTTTDNPKAESYAFGWYTGPQPTNFAAYSEHTSVNRYLDVTNYVSESAVYYFYIQIVGDGTRYLTSNRSATISYDNSSALLAPLLEISGTTLSWTGVINATGYRLYKNGILLKSFTSIEARTYNISSQIIDSILYNFEVEALGGTSGGITYANSLRSNIITYTEHLKLSVPQNIRVLIDEQTSVVYLTWNTVQRASGYTIKLDSNPNAVYTVSSNQFVLTNVLTQAKRYSFEVKANATGVLIESGFSTVSYYDNYLPLSTPTIQGARRNGGDVLVVWNEIQNAESYTLLVNGNVLTDIHLNPLVIYDTEVLISGELEKLEGGFDLEVYANGYDFYLTSETSELFYYSGIDLLQEPENVSYLHNTEDGTVIVTWDEVAGATYYFVAINNEVFSTTELEVNIEDLLEEGQIVQIRIQARGEGFTVPSQYSPILAFNYVNAGSEPYASYTTKFFYYRNYYDYYITSQQEMNAYIAYLISHQIEDNDSLNRHIAYIDYELTTEQESEADLVANGGNEDGILTISEEINYKQRIALLSYTETHRLSYYPPTLAGIPNAYRFRLLFDYDMIPTLISPQVNYVQSEDLLPYSSINGRDENYNNFASELSLIEVVVENSDQLFMVVNSGAKPMFTTEDSQVEQVYLAAKAVLRQIIDDTMTDYQKTLAIFDYVSYNTVYDHYVYDLAVQVPSPDNLNEYRVFYLEGVLLDGKAVCDGVAKTIALLLNMEGIEAIKVNGQANGGSGSVGHAWNKVNLEIDGAKNWYVIDATWSDVTSQDSVEYLSRRYFLLSDADIATTHFAASNVYNPVAETEFDYYVYAEYVTGYNFYIQNQTELNHLFDYFINNSIEGVEIKLAQGFTPNWSSALSYAGVSGVSINRYAYFNNTLNLVDFIYQ
ncbi:MAG: hypothetical protein CVV59_00820 [Tenericutes bacterium HGW-Tenericutes-4]|nr:MAG: hypothetical protein CVV59_00820 [Tenericutes bacterium HGW-Tenericutes-4]